MPSSTSSSRISHTGVRVDRPLPDQPWGRIGALMAVVVLLGLGAWEARVRAMGYGISHNDTPGLWALWRDKLDEPGNKAVVIAGASRIRFGLSHEAVSQAFDGATVVNLSMNGSVVRPVLHDLATDDDFNGIVLCGYTPGLFWAPGGPNMDETMKWLDARPRRTPSDKLGTRLALLPESVLAFLKKDDLAFPKLVRGLLRGVPNRAGVRLPPELPPYLATIRADRREVMWKKLETDLAFQERIKGIWKVLFSFARPLPPDLLAKLRAEVAADVKAIRARGGDVIFICFPSTGWLRDFERETMPRETYWEPLLAETASIGIHFEDYPELSHYECPEWSHLTGADAETFSRDAVRILAEKRAD